jgi:hypothetical protein
VSTLPAITRDELEWPRDRLPAIPSYEVSGVVTEVSPDVIEWRARRRGVRAHALRSRGRRLRVRRGPGERRRPQADEPEPRRGCGRADAGADGVAGPVRARRTDSGRAGARPRRGRRRRPRARPSSRGSTARTSSVRPPGPAGRLRATSAPTRSSTTPSRRRDRSSLSTSSSTPSAEMRSRVPLPSRGREGASSPSRRSRRRRTDGTVTALYFVVEQSGDQLDGAARLIDAGRFRPRSTRLSPADGAAAFTRVQTTESMARSFWRFRDEAGGQGDTRFARSTRARRSSSRTRGTPARRAFSRRWGSRRSRPRAPASRSRSAGSTAERRSTTSSRTSKRWFVRPTSRLSRPRERLRRRAGGGGECDQ